MNNNKEKQREYKKVCCPNCNSHSVVKRGLRQTENRGKIQRFGCNDCGKRFVQDDGFFRMRNNPQKITLCLDLFYRGVSTRKVQEHLQAFYPHNSSHKTIYEWVIKYAQKISKFTDNLKLNVGKELQIDEMEYGRRKHHRRKGVDRNWFIDAIDCQTRFMVSSEYVKQRKQKEIKKVLARAKKNTSEQFKIISSDGLLAYPRAVKSSFGYHRFQRGEIKHQIINASKDEGFCIMIERLHNSIRERTKTFRGFHGSVESANSVMKGYEIFYNFIRKHQAIGKCPYELACPEFKEKLNEPNKWLSLIQLAKQNN
ncbi:MAG: DDE-type integrase/transposase/recombinase [Nanoarchaeota archaeon]|nr:DDE-type integrase/transposase/recombinase [Nanoarchaeota archaeon]